MSRTLLELIIELVCSFYLTKSQENTLIETEGKKKKQNIGQDCRATTTCLHNANRMNGGVFYALYSILHQKHH